MRVLVACGGTGGHIFPALGFLERLKSKCKDLSVIIVVTKRKVESQIIPREYKIAYISLSPVRLSFDKKNLTAVIKLLIATIQSVYIILRFHPDVVVGFGGYASFPLVFFAKILGIKTVIHEQNVVAGISNRLLARFTDRIAISFNQTQEFFKAYSKKITLTSYPMRSDLLKVNREKALDFFGFSKDKFTILVTGGSQGSEKINKVFLEVLSEIQDKKNLQVIHLCGAGNFDNLLNDYKKMDISFKLFDFLRPIYYAYCAADLVITRAGATTIQEIIFFRLPAIIIPYPFAYQHQIANAKVLVDREAAILIEDNALNAVTLRAIIIDLFRNRNKINNMCINCENILPKDYQQDLSDVVTSLME